MATLSSTLKLQDRFTRTMRAAFKATEQVITAMDHANATAGKADIGKAFAAAQKEIEGAQKELNDFDNGLKNTNNESKNVARGITAWGRAIVVANQGMQLAQRLWGGLSNQMTKTDDLQGVNARLGLVNDGLRTQQQLQNAVRKAANDTRSEYNATASLVAKVAQTDIFTTNDGVIKFAERLNKTLIVSGASAAEQQSAILQLSQALGSGLLQGDELRSLQENAPMLMSYLAEGLGVTRGELKQLGADGELTSTRIAEAIMNMGDQIDADFASMPVTFGQAMTLIGNKAGALRERLLEPGQALDRIVQKAIQLVDYLNTDQGMAVIDTIGNGINWVIDQVMWLFDAFSTVYNFVSENWPTLAPIFAGIAAAVIALSVAQWASAAAQTAMNAAMTANPIFLVIMAIAALIAILVTLWNTNIEFRAGVIGIWNSILNFFDRVPIFFVRIGYGIANAFDTAKVMVLSIVDSMVNGVISAINWLIEQLNKIPGVSISAIGQVSFAASAQIEAEANRQARDSKVAEMVGAADKKAADREAQLQKDVAAWKAEADAANNASKSVMESGAFDSGDYNTTTAGGGGGGSKGGGGGGGGAAEKQIDLAEQQLKYLKDIAEQDVLGSFEALAAAMETGDMRLSRGDAELLRRSAGQSNVFYLNYQGGDMSATANISQGESLDDIRSKLAREAQEEIDTGLAGLYERMPG
ncbi:tape measure protein [Christensenellaceae bacterium OttesenSCG-928-M15]|nr:tape measure protein [Christensenellaceae bacterium OttesenSCG-928-M15]